MADALQYLFYERQVAKMEDWLCEFYIPKMSLALLTLTTSFTSLANFYYPHSCIIHASFFGIDSLVDAMLSHLHDSPTHDLLGAENRKLDSVDLCNGG